MSFFNGAVYNIESITKTMWMRKVSSIENIAISFTVNGEEVRPIGIPGAPLAPGIPDWVDLCNVATNLGHLLNIKSTLLQKIISSNEMS